MLWSLCWEFSVILSLFLSLSVGCSGLCGGKSVSMGRIMSHFCHFLSLSVGYCGICGGKLVSMGGLLVVFFSFVIVSSVLWSLWWEVSVHGKNYESFPSLFVSIS